MAVSIDDLNGLYKEVYSERLEKAVPDISIATKDFPMRKQDKIGKDYHQPVVLTNTQGVTFAGPKAGLYTLNPPVAMNIQDAIVPAYQMTMREQIPYDTAEQAMGGDKVAFVSSVGLIMQNMKESAYKYTETVALYGEKGIGAADASVNTNATTTVITVNSTDWAVGIWTASENAKIDIYQSDDTTQLNTTQALQITGVDIENKALTVTGAAADITAIDAWLAANNGAIIYWFGAKGNEMIGLDYTLTTSGVVSQIDNTNYSLWKGNEFNVNGKMTIDKFLEAISKAFGKGGLMSDAVMYLPHESWADLAADLASNRRFDSSYQIGKLQNGTKAIEFFSQNGLTKIKANPFVKLSEGFIFPEYKAGNPGALRRIGATEWTYNVANKGEIFFNRENENGFEVRMYTSQNFINPCPAKCVKLFGITPNT